MGILWGERSRTEYPEQVSVGEQTRNIGVTYPDLARQRRSRRYSDLLGRRREGAECLGEYGQFTERFVARGQKWRLPVTERELAAGQDG